MSKSVLLSFIGGLLAGVLFTQPALANVEKDNPQCEENIYDKARVDARKGPELDAFNWLAHDITTATIDDGFIIAFEKLYAPETRASDRALYRKYVTQYTPQNSGYLDAQGHRNTLLSKLWIDPKWPAVTNIASYSNGVKTDLYNPYMDAKNRPYRDASKIHRSFETGQIA